MPDTRTIEGMECFYREENDRIVVRVLLSDGSVRSSWWPREDFIRFSGETSPPTAVEEMVLVPRADVENFLSESEFDDETKQRIRTYLAEVPDTDVTYQ